MPTWFLTLLSLNVVSGSAYSFTRTRSFFHEEYNPQGIAILLNSIRVAQAEAHCTSLSALSVPQ